MKPTSILMLTVLSGLTFVACDTTPPRAVPDAVSAAAYPQIVAMGDLDEKVAFSKPIVTRGGEGRPLHIQAPVRLLRQTEREVQYRFLFFDERGRILNEDPDWQYTTLPPRTQVYLTGTALQESAYDWRLEIKESL